MNLRHSALAAALLVSAQLIAEPAAPPMLVPIEESAPEDPRALIQSAAPVAKPIPARRDGPMRFAGSSPSP